MGWSEVGNLRAVWRGFGFFCTCNFSTQELDWGLNDSLLIVLCTWQRKQVGWGRGRKELIWKHNFSVRTTQRRGKGHFLKANYRNWIHTVRINDWRQMKTQAPLLSQHVRMINCIKALKEITAAVNEKPNLSKFLQLISQNHQRGFYSVITFFFFGVGEGKDKARR